MEPVWQELGSYYQKKKNYQNVRAWFVLNKALEAADCGSIVLGTVTDFIGR